MDKNQGKKRPVESDGEPASNKRPQYCVQGTKHPAAVFAKRLRVMDELVNVLGTMDITAQRPVMLRPLLWMIAEYAETLNIVYGGSIPSKNLCVYSLVKLNMTPLTF